MGFYLFLFEHEGKRRPHKANRSHSEVHAFLCACANDLGIVSAHIMTRLEELKIKRNAALIVVSTLGLAGVYQIQSFGDIWRSNIFNGTSLSENGGVGFVLKIISFLFLTVLLAIPLFFIYFIKLIVHQIEINSLSRRESERNRLAELYHAHPMGIEGTEHIARPSTYDPFSITYYYREDGQLYGPFTIHELAYLDIKADTSLGINGVDNWCQAREIDNLLDTLSLLSKLQERRQGR